MSSSGPVLALDLASGGVTACLIGIDLMPVSTGEAAWTFVADGDGAETLSASAVLDATALAVRSCMNGQDPPEAIALSSMMHSLLITSPDGQPRSPVFGWNDRRDGAFVRRTRDQLGNYRDRTGCHFHPSFPAFKLAWMAWSGSDCLAGDYRIASLKGYVQAALTQNWAEDVSTASASGLLNLETGEWDPETLGVLECDPVSLPSCIPCDAVAGPLTAAGAGQIGLPEGLPVVAGGGDGFLATAGSGCDTPLLAAATLGTTVSLRRFVGGPDRGADKRTFCYRSGPGRFLSGCAGNNGGNVLEWMTDTLGPIHDSDHGGRPPIFLPFLYGERAPFWDASLRPRWIGVNGASLHELRSAVVESLAFELAAYLELTTGHGQAPEALVLSGNAFGFGPVAPKLAAVVPIPVLLPDRPGFATLRGAARCGFQALGLETDDAAGQLVTNTTTIEPAAEEGIEARYSLFREVYLSEV